MAARKRLKIAENDFVESSSRYIEKKETDFLHDNVEELSKSDYEYFCNVFKRLTPSFDDEEDREIYFNNIFKAMIGCELQLVTHPKLSLALENLLSGSTATHFVGFFEPLVDHGWLATHHSGSHLLQKLLEMSLKYLANEDWTESDEMATRVIKLITSFAKRVKKDLPVLEQDRYACHVISSLLQTLSGCQVSRRTSQTKKFKDQIKKDVTPDICTPEERIPKKFRKVLVRLLDKLFKIDGLKGLTAEDSSSSVVLQTALLVMSKRHMQQLEQCTASLINCLFEESEMEVMDVLTNRTLTPVVETLLCTCPHPQFTTMWDNYFKGKLRKMAVHPSANYVAQALLRSAPSRAELEIMFDEIQHSWNEIATAGHLGVLVALCEACYRLSCHQPRFVDRLATLLHCAEPADRKKLLVPLTATWTFYEEYEKYGGKPLKSEEDTFSKPINYHGSLLVQYLLKFNKPLLVVESLLGMNTSVMIDMFCSACGSHLLDTFATSIPVGAKSRQRMADKLKGNYLTLACNKYGSRCLETFWKSLDLKGRTQIAQELVQCKTKLRRHPFGGFLFATFAIETFRTRPSVWNKQQVRKNKPSDTSTLSK